MLGEGEGLLCSSQGLLKEDAQAMQIAGVRLLEFFSIARSYSRGGAGVASSRAPEEATQKWVQGMKTVPTICQAQISGCFLRPLS